MSQRVSGYARQERDLYETPAWVTEALCDHVSIPKVVWEPSAGTGAIKRVLEARGHCVFGTDLAAHPEAEIEERNFLMSMLVGLDTRAIVTNPPYDHAQEFVDRAITLMRPVNGLVAMLLRIDFDSAKTRAHLFRDCPAWHKKLVLTKRIVWFEGGKSPSFNHAWYIWTWNHQNAPTIGYAP